MSGTIVRIGATGAGALLALGLLAAPPAGAAGDSSDGKGQRTLAACFDAAGDTQGRSQSDPDGMSNGGFDKPGCTGGFDSDRDGNNGCGNDADREDDNNGRCEGRKDRPVVEPGKAEEAKVKAKADEARVSAAGTVAVAGSAIDAAAGTTAAATDSTVAAAGTTSDAGGTAPAVDTAVEASTPGTTVLGESITRPGTLARTGAGVGGLALLGGLLCSGGRAAILARRFLRIG